MVLEVFLIYQITKNLKVIIGKWFILFSFPLNGKKDDPEVF
jgi:hypothetical protein